MLKDRILSYKCHTQKIFRRVAPKIRPRKFRLKKYQLHFEKQSI